MIEITELSSSGTGGNDLSSASSGYMAQALALTTAAVPSAAHAAMATLTGGSYAADSGPTATSANAAGLISPLASAAEAHSGSILSHPKDDDTTLGLSTPGHHGSGLGSSEFGHGFAGEDFSGFGTVSSPVFAAVVQQQVEARQATVQAPVHINSAPVQSGVPDLGSMSHSAAPIVVSAATLLAGTSDADGDHMTVGAVSADHGSVHDNGNDTWTVTPDSGHVGPVSVSYTVNDGHGGITAATATLTETNAAPILPLDLSCGAPVAQNQTDSSVHDVRVTWASQNDGTTIPTVEVIDGSGVVSNVTIQIYDVATGNYLPVGGVPIDISTQYVTINYDVDFTSTGGGLQTGQSIYAVNLANPDCAAALSVYRGGVVTGYIGGFDADHDTMSLSIGTDGAHGHATVNAQGQWTYTAGVGFVGADSFSVSVSDGHGGVASRTVDISIDNRPPTIDSTSAPGGYEGHGVLAGAITVSDADADTLTYSQAALHVVESGVLATDTVDLNTDATFTVSRDGNQLGSETLTAGGPPITLDDIAGAISRASGWQVQVDKVQVGGQWTLTAYTGDGSITTLEIAVTGDINGGTQTLSDWLGLQAGTHATHGTVTIHPDGTIDYAPAAGEIGTDPFAVKTDDGHGGVVTQVVEAQVYADNPYPNTSFARVMTANQTMRITTEDLLYGAGNQFV